MKMLVRLEEFAMLALGMLLFTFLDYSWWIFPLLLLLPDISMAGYLVNERIGAILYNLFHHKGVAILIYILGVITAVSFVMLVGVILFSHSSLDRMLGYGLKHPDSFQHTHLGWIGNKQKPNLRE